VPSTVSQQAAEFLRTVHVQPQAALRNKPASEAARVRAEFDALTVPGSAAALAEYLQGVSNQTLSGVPVLFAVPKGARRDGRLLLYVHGGAYIKGACANLWQVRCAAAWQALSRPKPHLHTACRSSRRQPKWQACTLRALTTD
jgi:acetyl esterase/lipase